MTQQLEAFMKKLSLRKSFKMFLKIHTNKCKVLSCVVDIIPTGNVSCIRHLMRRLITWVKQGR